MSRKLAYDDWTVLQKPPYGQAAFGQANKAIDFSKLLILRKDRCPKLFKPHEFILEKGLHQFLVVLEETIEDAVPDDHVHIFSNDYCIVLHHLNVLDAEVLHKDAVDVKLVGRNLHEDLGHELDVVLSFSHNQIGVSMVVERHTAWNVDLHHEGGFLTILEIEDEQAIILVEHTQTSPLKLQRKNVKRLNLKFIEGKGIRVNYGFVGLDFVNVNACCSSRHGDVVSVAMNGFKLASRDDS